MIQIPSDCPLSRQSASDFMSLQDIRLHFCLMVDDLMVNGWARWETFSPLNRTAQGICGLEFCVWMASALETQEGYFFFKKGFSAEKYFYENLAYHQEKEHGV